MCNIFEYLIVMHFTLADSIQTLPMQTYQGTNVHVHADHFTESEMISSDLELDKKALAVNYYSAPAY